MQIDRFIKIARILFIAQKVNDIKPYVKLDLIARQYGKQLKQGKLWQYEQIMQQKYPDKFKKYNDLVAKTIGDISVVVNNYLQKNSPQALWFYHRYIMENKHIQDIIKIDGSQQPNGSLINVLKGLQTYQNYDKSTKKQLRDGKKGSDGRIIIKPLFDVALNSKYTFESLTDLMHKKEKKPETTKKQFFAPKSIQQIKIPGVSNYHVYKAMGNNQKHGQELHNIDGLGTKRENAKSKYEEYYSYFAKWCVITGSAPWGGYLQNPWNYYYYVTTSNNQPYILMNFGRTSNAQIKNIEDHSFSNYDQQIFTIVEYLSQKDNFDTLEGSNDYKAFNKIKDVAQNKLDKQNLQQINELDGLVAYKQKDDDKVVYVYKNDLPKYLIVNSNPVKLDQMAKLTDISFIKLLQKLSMYESIYSLIDKGMLSEQNKQSYDIAIQCLLSKMSSRIIKLLQDKKLQFNSVFIDVMNENKQYNSLVDLIQKNYVTKESIINKICSWILKQGNACYPLYRLLKANKLPLQYYNKTMAIFLKNGRYVSDSLFEKYVNDDWKSKFVCFVLEKQKKYYGRVISQRLIEKDFVNDVMNLFANKKIEFGSEIGIKSVATDIINKFDNIDIKYIYKIVSNIYKNDMQLVDFINYVDNDIYLNQLYDFAKQKKLTKLLSVFVYVDKAKQQDKNEIIQNSVQNKDDTILGNMIALGKLTDEQQIKTIINRFIRSKNVSHLIRILQSKRVSNIPTQLLLKSIKTICQNGGNPEKVNAMLTTMFTNGKIPYDYGYLFIKYYKANWIYFSDQWSKKYFNQKFIDQLLNKEDPLTLTDAIQKDKINVKYIPYILNKRWNNQKYRDYIAREVKGYKPRFHLPYRQAIFSWLLQNDFKWLAKNCDQLKDDFYSAIISKLLTQDTELILQFVKAHHYKISSKQANAIFEKIKNQDVGYLICLYRDLNDQNKKQLINKIIQSNNMDNLYNLFNANWNGQFNGQQSQLIINYIKTMPINQFVKIFINTGDKDSSINNASIERILNDINNPSEYAEIYFKIHWWSVSDQNTQKLKQKFFNLCNNQNNVRQMYNVAKQLQKQNMFIDILLSNDVDKYTNIIANINFGQIEYYLKHLQGNPKKMNKIIQNCMKQKRWQQKLKNLTEKLKQDNLRERQLKKLLNKYLNEKGLV